MAKIPFQLETWLKDKSQKVETGVGEPVRILCTNAAGLLSIIGNVGENSENLQRWTEKGQYHVGINTPDKDLFIITPEEELTPFEDALQKKIAFVTNTIVDDDSIREWAAELLSLAEKELEEEIPELEFEPIEKTLEYKAGYKQAKKEIISLIKTRIAEIPGDAQPNPILRIELQELIKQIEESWVK